MTVIGKLITTGMPQHVWMNLEPNLGFVAGAGEELADANRECAPT